MLLGPCCWVQRAGYRSWAAGLAGLLSSVGQGRFCCKHCHALRLPLAMLPVGHLLPAGHPLLCGPWPSCRRAQGPCLPVGPLPGRGCSIAVLVRREHAGATWGPGCPRGTGKWGLEWSQPWAGDSACILGLASLVIEEPLEPVLQLLCEAASPLEGSALGCSVLMVRALCWLCMLCGVLAVPLCYGGRSRVQARQPGEGRVKRTLGLSRTEEPPVPGEPVAFCPSQPSVTALNSLASS